MSWFILAILFSGAAVWIYLLRKSFLVYKHHLEHIEASSREQMELFTSDCISVFREGLRQPADDLMVLIEAVRNLRGLCDERTALEQEIIRLKAILARKEKRQ